MSTSLGFGDEWIEWISRGLVEGFALGLAFVLFEERIEEPLCHVEEEAICSSERMWQSLEGEIPLVRSCPLRIGQILRPCTLLGK